MGFQDRHFIIEKEDEEERKKLAEKQALILAKQREDDLAKAEEEQAEKERRSISAIYERTGIMPEQYSAKPSDEKILTKSDVVNYAINLANQTGQSDRLEGKSQDEIYDMFLKANPDDAADIEAKVFVPSYGDIIDAGVVQQYENFRYNMPAWAITMWDQSTNKETAFTGTPLQDLSIDLMFRQGYKELNPYATDEEINLELGKAKEDNRIYRRLAAKLLEEGDAYVKDYADNNPKFQATLEWLAGQKVMEGKELPKIMTNLTLNVLPSMMVSGTAGRLGAKIATTVASPTGNPYIIGGAGLIGAFAGQGISGFLLEGADFFDGSITHLKEDRNVTIQEASNFMTGAWKIFNDMPEDERNELYPPDILGKIDENSFRRLYAKTNFKVDKDGVPIRNADGTFTRLGLSTEDAIEASVYGAQAYATVAGGIEMIGEIPFVKKMFGLTGKKMLDSRFGKYTGMKFLSGFVDKADDIARVVPKTTGRLATMKRYGAQTLYRGLARSGGESTEEVLQTLADFGTEAGGPFFMNKEYRFNDELSSETSWGAWKKVYDSEQLIQAALGGFIGGGISSASPIMDLVSDDVSRKVNLANKGMADRQAGEFVYVDDVKNENNKYGLNLAISKRNEDGTIERVSDESIEQGALVDPETGEGIASEYDNIKDAYRAAEILTNTFKEESEKKTAWQYKSYVNGTAKVVENKVGEGQAPEWSVRTYNEEGKLIKIEGNYESKREAKGVEKNINKNIKRITKYHDKYGGIEGLETEDTVKKYEKAKLNQASQNIDEKTEAGETPDRKDTAYIGMQVWMGKSVGRENFEKVEEAMPDLATNPKTVIDMIKAAKENPNLDIDDADIRDQFYSQFTQDDFDSNLMTEELFQEFDELVPDVADELVPEDTDIPIGAEPVVDIEPPVAEQDAPEETSDLIPPGFNIEDVEAPPTKIDDDIYTSEGKLKPGEQYIKTYDKAQLEQFISEQEDIIKESPETIQSSLAKGQIRTAKKRLSEVGEEAPIKPTKKAKEKRISLEDQKKINEASFEIDEFSKMDGVNIIRAPRTEPERIGTIEIDKDKQQKGLGTKIVNSFKKLMRAQGKTRIVIDVNAGSEGFWEKQGFVFVAETREGYPIPPGDNTSTINPPTKPYGRWTMEYDLTVPVEAPEGRKGTIKDKQLTEILKGEGVSDEQVKSLLLRSKVKAITERLDLLFKKFEGKISYTVFPKATKEVKALMKEQGASPTSSAWYNPVDKTVYVIGERSGMKEAFHEFSHPYIQEIRLENPKLFNELYDTIAKTDQGKEIIARVKDRYKELKPSSALFKEEVMVFSLESLSEKEYNANTTFMQSVKKVWNFIKEKIFGVKSQKKIFVKNLGPDTTLEQISRFIAKDDGVIIDLDIDRLDAASKMVRMRDDVVSDEVIDQEDLGEFNDTLEESLNYLNNYKAHTKRVVRDVFQYSYDTMSGFAERLDKKLDVRDFRDAMLIAFSDRPDLHGDLMQWIKEKFENPSDKDFNEFKSVDISGSHDMFLSFKDAQLQAEEIYNDIREGLEESLNSKGSKEDSISEADMSKIAGVYISDFQRKRIFRKGLESDFDTFTDWLKSEIFVVLGPSKIPALRRYYNRVNTSYKTNGELSSIGGIISPDSNHISNLNLLKESEDSLSLQYKSVRNLSTGHQNPQYAKHSLYTYSVRKNAIKPNLLFLSGGDTLVSKKLEDAQGNLILNEEGESQIKWEPSYRFLSENEMSELNKLFSEDGEWKGHAIAFSRGDSDKVMIVRIGGNNYHDAKDGIYQQYWEDKRKYLGTTKSKQDRVIKNLTKGTEYQRAQEIAVFELMNDIFPGYLKKDGTEIFKRLKIPFTPVTISNEMPSFRIDKINAKDVNFRLADGEAYPALSRMGNLTWQYINDGASLTSSVMFNDFTKYHGLKKGSATAKTTIYHKDGDKVLALKHLQVKPEPGFIIEDKQGNVLYTVNENSEIKDADGNDVHIIATSDEAKIWWEQDADSVKDIPGEALGFIKFDEDSPQFTKHPTQIYNHIDYDMYPELLQAFESHYMSKMRRDVRNTNRLTISTDKGDAPDKIAKWLSGFTSEDLEMGFASALSELGKLKAGLHHSTGPWLDQLLYRARVHGVLNLDKSNGSRYKINPDWSGQLQTDLHDSPYSEVSLSLKESRMIVNKYIASGEMDSYDFRQGTDEQQLEVINDWLMENEVFVVITRVPVPPGAGVMMARVKSLHNRKGAIDINPEDVKVKLEGDDDGDAVQVELLADEIQPAYKRFFDEFSYEGLNLAKYTQGQKKVALSDVSERLAYIVDGTAGRKSIAEIANVLSFYGNISHSYNHFTIGGFKVIPRKRTDIIKWQGESMTIDKYLRIWLQAAVDNSKYGLLQQWGYTKETSRFEPNGQARLMMSLFEIEITDGVRVPFSYNVESLGEQQSDLNYELYSQGLKLVIDKLKIASTVKRGESFADGKLKYSDAINLSSEYAAFLNYEYNAETKSYTYDKNFTLTDKVSGRTITSDVKNHTLTPLEMIAVIPSSEFEFM